MNYWAYSRRTIQAINETHAKSLENNSKKLNYHWRTNNPTSKRKALGWLPFKTICHQAYRHATKQAKGLKIHLQLIFSQRAKAKSSTHGTATTLALYQINTSRISIKTARNCWYACITVKEPPQDTMWNGQRRYLT